MITETINLNQNHGCLRDNVLDIVEEMILRELEQSSTACEVRLMIGRRHQKRAVSYIEQILGYRTKILDDSKENEFSLISVSWAQ